MSTARSSTGPFLRTPAGIALLVFLAVAALLLEHRARVLGAWRLRLLLCAAMHFFMQRGHGHGGHGTFGFLLQCPRC